MAVFSAAIFMFPQSVFAATVSGEAKTSFTSTDATRYWMVSTASGRDATTVTTNQTFELAANGSINLNFSVGTSGISPPGVANQITIQILDDNSDTVRATLASAVAEGNIVNPLTFTPALAGTFRIKITAQKTDGTGGIGNYGPVNSDTDGNKGYLRAGVTLSDIAVSNSLGGSLPAPFAWPDSARTRITVGNAANSDDSTRGIDYKLLNQDSADAVLRTFTNTAAKNTTTWDDNNTGFALDTSDTGNAMGLRNFKIQLTGVANSPLSTRPWVHFESAPSGWTIGTTDGGLNTTKGVSVTSNGSTPTNFQYDSTVTLSALNNQDDSGANTRVYNRGEVATVKVDVKNARGAAFTARGTETIKSARTTDSATEETCSLSTSGATKTCTITYATSGNNSPATSAGDTKGLKWTDSASNSPAPAITAQYGALSSLLTVDNIWHSKFSTDSSEASSFIIGSDLMQVKTHVQNVRGGNQNGATVICELFDPNSVSGGTCNGTSGSDGYTGFKQYTPSAPAGAWSLQASATLSGNSSTTRSENISFISPYIGDYAIEAVGWNQTYDIGDTARFTIRTLKRNSSGTFVATVADSAPTYTLRYWDGATWQDLASGSMTALGATATYETTYAIPNDSAWIGRRVAVSFSAVMSGTRINTSREIEIVGSPAQVIINSITDTTIPTISASVRITNEGTAAFEYTYEYCIVTSNTNQCGGGNDEAYGSAAKLISAGQNFDTTLTLNVTQTGNYIFKVAVWWSNQSSKSSKTFTTTSEPAPTSTPTPSGGGGGGGGYIAPTPTPPPTTDGKNTFSAVWEKIAEIFARLLGIESRVGNLEAKVTALEQKLAERAAAPAPRKEIPVPQKRVAPPPVTPEVEALPKTFFQIRLR